MALQPFEWKDKPALIEHLFPVQKISVESYKEQMAGAGKTLTALGSYWKGRKPLFLNKACILGALLPVTENSLKDLQVFEMLMGMDIESMEKRIYQKLSSTKKHNVQEYLVLPYSEQVKNAKRPEEIGESLFLHIWDEVNNHLGTSANSISELITQIGIARYGRCPKVADVFSGSGQIPFEAARIGCDVYASDLNPIACMLTWGSFNIVGTSKEKRLVFVNAQKDLISNIEEEVSDLEVESNKYGWKAKVFLYCAEVICPQTGWKVPLLPSLIVSKPRSGSKNNVVVKLVPNEREKRYEIEVIENVDEKILSDFSKGTVQNGEVVHSPNGNEEVRVNISSIRGDYKDGTEIKNKLRLWSKDDFSPSSEDIFQERLYCIQWTYKKEDGKGEEYTFRSVNEEDLFREEKVLNYVRNNFKDWQEQGYVPDMIIEKGVETERLYRERGWTHWHHLFNPRQLMYAALTKKYLEENTVFSLTRLLNQNSRLSRWDGNSGGGGCVQAVFDNQALNTLYNYGCRGFEQIKNLLNKEGHQSEISSIKYVVESHPAQEIEVENDIYITDPPYGDAVKYEEITEFFIAWLRKNPPKAFANWTWDSRRSLAVKGEDDNFRHSMIATYGRLASKMPDNGIQILMFTHQSGTIWSDMANIVWASGLQVSAAWYIVTETGSALRDGAYVTGTIILVLRKRHENVETFRDELGWEIEDAVKEQVEALIGLDKEVRGQRSEGLYADADLQMAGYAAALKVLTSYSRIDGRDMVVEAEAPRIKGEKTFVDELIDFAVQTAVQFLVPVGFEKEEWQKLQPIERLYMKMLEMEQQGAKTLDNYQNFTKAFKIQNFDQVMSEGSKANAARLKLSTEFKGAMMSGSSEIAETPLRALLYAMYEMSKELEVEDILDHLMDNCPNYLQNKPLLVKMADYIAEKRTGLKSTKTFKPDEEASYARILAEAIRNQRL